MVIFCPEVNQISPTTSRFQKIFPERNPQTLAYRGREGKGRGWEEIKGFIPLKKVQRERTGGILLQGLKGDRRPWHDVVITRALRVRQVVCRSCHQATRMEKRSSNLMHWYKLQLFKTKKLYVQKPQNCQASIARFVRNS